MALGELREPWDENEENARPIESTEGCVIECAPILGKCEIICAVAVGEEFDWPPYYAYERIEHREKGEFDYEGEKQALKKTIELNKEEGVPVVLGVPSGRVVVKYGRPWAMVPRDGDASKCSLVGEHDVVRLEEEPKVVCVPKEAVRHWPRVLEEHPVVQAIFAAHRRFLGKRIVGDAYGDPGIKGVYDENKLEAGVNKAWLEINNFSVALGLKMPKEVAEEELRVQFHEYAHYIDHINSGKLVGSWTGERPLEVLAHILTGLPVPAGSERDAEDLAHLALDALKAYDYSIIEEKEEEVARRAGEDAKYFDWVEPVKKVIDALFEEGLIDHAEVQADFYRDYLVISLDPGSDEKLGVEVPPEPKEADWHEHTMWYKEARCIRCRALKEKVLAKFRELGYDLEELGLEVEAEDEEIGWFNLLSFVHIKIPYPWYTRQEDVDIDLREYED